MIGVDISHCTVFWNPARLKWRSAIPPKCISLDLSGIGLVSVLLPLLYNMCIPILWNHDIWCNSNSTFCFQNTTLYIYTTWGRQMCLTIHTLTVLIYGVSLIWWWYLPSVMRSHIRSHILWLFHFRKAAYWRTTTLSLYSKGFCCSSLFRLCNKALPSSKGGCG